MHAGTYLQPRAHGKESVSRWLPLVRHVVLGTAVHNADDPYMVSCCIIHRYTHRHTHENTFFSITQRNATRNRDLKRVAVEMQHTALMQQMHYCTFKICVTRYLFFFIIVETMLTRIEKVYPSHISCVQVCGFWTDKYFSILPIRFRSWPTSSDVNYL